MTDPVYKMAMDSIGFAAQILTPQADQISALTAAESGMHSYLHITDPTMYRAAIYSKNLRWQIEMSKAALAFILAVQQVKSEIAKGAGDADQA